MQLAATRHRPRVRRVGIRDAQGHVSLQLAIQALAHLARGEQLAFAAGQALGVPLPFRPDSLLGLVRSAPDVPNMEEVEALGIKLRPFDVS